MSSFGSIAGKVFLLGEYAVLTGLPCMVAAVGPRFVMRAGPRSMEASGLSEIHPESPAGKLMAWSEKTISREARDAVLASLTFEDPWKGAGGFGASTAQYALLYSALAARAGWDVSPHSAWKLYRELTRKESEGQSPSGADLIAQWKGGVNWFDPMTLATDELSSAMDFSGLMIFSATGQTGRKVATHEHLDSLRAENWRKTSESWRRALEPSLKSGVQAVRRGDVEGFGLAMNDYASALQALGLEIAPTRADREAFSRIRGVVGVKGAGAMQADAILVLADPVAGPGVREEVRKLGESRGLRLVCEGLLRGGSQEPGLVWS